MADPRSEDTLGARLAQARRLAGLSQALAAPRLGVTTRTVGNWEADRSQPKADQLAALAALYGVSPADLLAP